MNTIRLPTAPMSIPTPTAHRTIVITQLGKFEIISLGTKKEQTKSLLFPTVQSHNLNQLKKTRNHSSEVKKLALSGNQFSKPVYLEFPESG